MCLCVCLSTHLCVCLCVVEGWESLEGDCRGDGYDIERRICCSGKNRVANVFRSLILCIGIFARSYQPCFAALHSMPTFL